MDISNQSPTTFLPFLWVKFFAFDRKKIADIWMVFFLSQVVTSLVWLGLKVVRHPRGVLYLSKLDIKWRWGGCGERVNMGSKGYAEFNQHCSMIILEYWLRLFYTAILCCMLIGELKWHWNEQVHKTRVKIIKAHRIVCNVALYKWIPQWWLV